MQKHDEDVHILSVLVEKVVEKVCHRLECDMAADHDVPGNGELMIRNFYLAKKCLGKAKPYFFPLSIFRLPPYLGRFPTKSIISGMVLAKTA